MKRFPVWLWIGVGVLAFAVLAVAAFLKLLLEEPPEHARVPAIQELYGSQLEILRRLAGTIPPGGCPVERSPQEVMQRIETMKPWWDAVDEVRHRFDDPAILEASIVDFCDGSTSEYGIKSGNRPSDAWSVSALLAPEEGPSVSVWHWDSQALVRYEDRFDGPDGAPRGLRLLLDAERMQGG